VLRLAPRRRHHLAGAVIAVALAFTILSRVSPPLAPPDPRPATGPSADLTGAPPAARPAAPAAAGQTDRALPGAPVADGTLPPAIHTAAAVVLDAGSGAMLYGAAARQRREPASITKIMTAMVALEHGDLDAPVTVDIDGNAFAEETDSSVMGLEPGETLTLRDLLYGLMLPSGNDAAIAIARAVAGSEQAFVDLMNQTAARLGLADTHFTNPHGLHDPNHYTSAYDMAKLARWAMNDPRFRQIVETPEWTIHGSRTYTVVNGNPLLGHYPGADGVKVGWHEESGPTIVGSATRDGHRVIVVLLDTQQELPDTSALLDWAFTHYAWKSQSG
jgi:D-alanyl-D-alanine carboxypeptidase (penicillin-binding protein 5/6)